MTDLEIQEEAKKRYAELPEEEKLSVWCPDLKPEERAFLEHVEEVGYKHLSAEEKRRFTVLAVHANNLSLPGGIIDFGVMKHLEEQYKISREDLANGTKNPFKRELLLRLLVGLCLAAVGALVAYFAGKANVEVGRIAGIVVSAVGGLLAVRASSVVSAVFRFKAIQKKVVSGELDEEFIKKEVYSLVTAEKRKIWFRKEET